MYVGDTIFNNKVYRLGLTLHPPYLLPGAPCPVNRRQLKDHVICPRIRRVCSLIHVAIETLNKFFLGTHAFVFATLVQLLHLYLKWRTR